MIADSVMADAIHRAVMSQSLAQARDLEAQATALLDNGYSLEYLIKFFEIRYYLDGRPPELVRSFE